MEDYECSVCGETFQNEDELAYHIREAHASEDIRNFKCSLCGDTFETAGELAQHIKDDHPSN
jgi:hypothetical protein